MGIVPISKSIWVLILFVCANFHFAALIRFNLFANFSLLFFREPSKPPPPNFAPPFCALCLIVYDFLPKTWDLGRKITPSGSLRSPAPPRGRLSALPQSFPPPLKPSPWGRWLDAKRQDGRGAPSRQRARPLSQALSGLPALPKGEPLA